MEEVLIELVAAATVYSNQIGRWRGGAAVTTGGGISIYLFKSTRYQTRLFHIFSCPSQIDTRISPDIEFCFIFAGQQQMVSVWTQGEYIPTARNEQLLQVGVQEEYRLGDSGLCTIVNSPYLRNRTPDFETDRVT